MKGLYSRGRYLEGIRKFEECERLSERIQERDKRRRSIIGKKEKRKTKDSRGRVKSRSRGV